MGEMKMKAISSSILCLGAVLLAAPALRGQDFSKYRDFSLGTSLASVLKHTDKKPTDVECDACVDVTLSTTGQPSIHRYPFNARDYLALIGTAGGEKEPRVKRKPRR
jgi:hypothetical protein